MIVILPGSSAVGRETIAALRQAGIPRDGIVAGARNPAALEGLPARAVVADYDDPPSLRAAFAGARTVALIPTKSPPAQRCVELSNALHAAEAAGAERVVFLSIVTATPQSVAAIAPFILFAENATRNSGMDWAILRMGLYLEPVADWAPELATMGRLPYPVRSGKAAYVTRVDVARTLAALCADPSAKGGIYFASAPPITMPQLAGALSSALGRTIAFDACSPDEFIDICKMSNEPPFITRVLLSLYRAVECGEMDNIPSDVERLTGTPAETASAYFSRVLRPAAR